MVTTILKHPILTAEQYLKDELERPEKCEFVNGQIYAMSGASRHHGLLSVSLGNALYNNLPEECDLFIADMKVRIDTKEVECYYYPDIAVSCSEDDKDDYFLNAPKLIIEVLSPSTERTDRSEKLSHYKLIPSVEEIVLVAQDSPKLEIYRRANAWQQEIFYLEDSVRLESVALDIDMAAIYKKCVFDTKA